MTDLLYYVLCGALAAGLLAGIALMRKAKTALIGNLAGVLCVAGAVLLTLFRHNILGKWELLLFSAVGLALGLYWAHKVKMSQMPQMVALRGGLGSIASSIAAIVAVTGLRVVTVFELAAAGAALAVGAAAFAGSAVTAARLHGLTGQKPQAWKRHKEITIASLAAAAVSILMFALLPPQWLPVSLFVCGAAGGLFGVAFAIRVGGADLPIAISLLNALSGLAVAAAGMTIGEPLLVTAGGIVGGSGLLLTQLMCRAADRSLSDILKGKAPAASGN